MPPRALVPALVFVIPAVASVALAGAVMAQLLQEPGRGGSESYLEILGLEASYAAPAAIEASVLVTHASFDCGDLYVHVRDSETGELVIQQGFLGQCYARSGALIPADGAFRTVIDDPGRYELGAVMSDAHGRHETRAAASFEVS